MASDLIDRGELFPNGFIVVNGSKPILTLNDLINKICNAPAVDAVEVVRCKDCENWDTDWCPSHSAKGEHWCGMIDLVTEPDFFCGYGERKKEDAVD